MSLAVLGDAVQVSNRYLTTEFHGVLILRSSFDLWSLLL